VPGSQVSPGSIIPFPQIAGNLGLKGTKGEFDAVEPNEGEADGTGKVAEAEIKVVEDAVPPTADVEDKLAPATDVEDKLAPATDVEDTLAPAADEEDVLPAAVEDEAELPFVEDALAPAADEEDVLPAAVEDEAELPFVEDALAPATEDEAELPFVEDALAPADEDILAADEDETEAAAEFVTEPAGEEEGLEPADATLLRDAGGLAPSEIDEDGLEMRLVEPDGETDPRAELELVGVIVGINVGAPELEVEGMGGDIDCVPKSGTYGVCPRKFPGGLYWQLMNVCGADGQLSIRAHPTCKVFAQTT